MTATMVSFLPQAPHELWQTAASPFIIPQTWQSMYQRCPRCGGCAPNICDEIWPDSWWEDDMMGLMYQGHIPPSQRVAPWEAYYTNSRVPYLPATPVQSPLRISTASFPYQTQVLTKPPMTPPTTPRVTRHVDPYYSASRPETPSTPTLQYSKENTWDSLNSFDNPQGSPAQITDLRTFSPLLYSNF